MLNRDNTLKKEIPVFFSSDDNYIPFLDVAIASLIENASKSYTYRIIILNTGISAENIAKVKQNERPGFSVEFLDISTALTNVRAYFKNVYHFSIVTYYRLFISSLFPQYDKIIYLDCDLVVTGDISELYNTEMGENIIAAVPDQNVKNVEAFRRYIEIAISVDPEKYINAGVLLINLDAFRKNEIEKKLVRLMTAFNFDLVDPDQAYINYLCKNKIHFLPNGWNKIPTELPCEGKKNIVHYALYKKPWQYDDVIDGEYFWQYAKNSPFCEEILQRKAAFGEKEKRAKEASAIDIVVHADKIAASDYTFSKKL
ncbi:MAG: glycosyltransferase family 8 protein [Clostridia bacterium]|nr:glycosyltransferase family 8 protein [Clostridia bacterium]